MPYELLSPSTSCKSSDSSSSCRMLDLDTQNPNLTKTTVEGSTRKRVYRACEVCRRKKVKCNGQKPCSHCIAFAEECYYVDTKDRSAYSRRYVESLEQRLAKMEKSLSLACSEAKLCGCKADRHTSASGTGERVGLYGVPSQFLSNKRYHDSSDLDVRGNRTRHGRSPVVAMFNEVNQIFAQPGLEIEETNCYDSLFDTHLLSTRKSSCVPLHEARAQLPQHDILNRLVASFFQHVYPVFPIVSEGELNEIVLHILCSTSDNDSIDAPSLALVHAVLACASRVARNEQSKDNPQHMQPSPLPEMRFGPPPLATAASYESVWDKAGAVYDEQSQILTSQSPSETTSQLTQVYALQAYYLASIGSAARAWIVTGSAMRLAVHLGMHQRVTTPGLSDFEKQIRSKIWWSIYMLDRVLGSTLGLPFGVDDRDIDAAMPDECRNDLVPGFAALVSLAKISGQISCITNDLHDAESELDESERQVQYGRTRALEKALDAWSQSLPASFKALNSDHSLDLQSCAASCLLHTTRLQLYKALHSNAKVLLRDSGDLLAKGTQTALQIVRTSSRVALVLPPSLWLYDFANSLVMSGGFLALNATKHHTASYSQLLSEAEGAVNGLLFVEQTLPDVRRLRQLLARMLRRVHEQLSSSQIAPRPDTQGPRAASEADKNPEGDFRSQKRRRAMTMCSSTANRTAMLYGIELLDSLGNSVNVHDGLADDTSRASPAYSDSAMQRVATTTKISQHGDVLDCRPRSIPASSSIEASGYTQAFEDILAQAPSLFTSAVLSGPSTSLSPSTLVGTPAEFADRAGNGSRDTNAPATFDAQSELGSFSHLLSDYINTPLQPASR